MKPVREIVSRETIDDLWGAGYTILPRVRHADPFHVPTEMIPWGRAYQWMHLVYDKNLFNRNGWAPVPASRHDGYFMLAGFIGDIEVNGLGLFEKPKFEVDEERALNAAKAKQMVTDWAEKNSALFSGEVTIGTGSDNIETIKLPDDIGTNKDHIRDHIDTVVGDIETIKVGATKSIENATKIPRDMVPYISEIFAERDALYDDLLRGWDTNQLTPSQGKIVEKYFAALKSDPRILKGPTVNSLLLSTAIDNVRKRITEEAKSGETSEH